MGRAFQSVAAPVMMNTSGRKLTTRIHIFPHVIDAILLLPENPNRLYAEVTLDAQQGFLAQVALTDGIEAAWITPYSMTYGSVTIYGSCPIYGRAVPNASPSYTTIIVLEHLYL